MKKETLRFLVCLAAACALFAGCSSDGSSSSAGTGGLVFTACPEGRPPGPVPCTTDYNPVCGLRDDGSTRSYPNACTACADLDVQGHWQGECVVIACTEPRPEICTREYVPVCAQLDDGTLETKPNACEACADDRVVSYLPGACR